MINEISSEKRIYVVGSEWLYYNIYIGPQTSDKFLIQSLSTLSKSLLKNELIDKWFFIRYKDEKGMHLRVRFHIKDLKNLGGIIFEFYEMINPYIKNRLIHNVTINTYKREIERYGFQTIDDFESLFWINSEITLKIIEMSNDNSEIKWLYGLKVIDVFLDNWNLSLRDKKQLLESLKIGFGKEFGIDKHIRKHLSRKYRENKAKIENIIANGDEDFNALLAVFINDNSTYVENILITMKNNEIYNSEKLDDFLSSYIHMFCNRLFQSKQRLHEFVLYDLLFENYYSRVARINAEKLIY